MKVNFVPETFNPKIYNSVIFHPLQSWEWGEVRIKTGLNIFRIGEFSENKLKNSYLVTLHNIPFTNFKIGYIARSSVPSKEILEFLKKQALKENVIFFKFEPYEKKADLKKLDLSNFKRSTHPLFPDWTIIQDISQDEKVLFNKLKPKTRYNIKLAQKKGIIIKEETNQKGYKIFEKLYFETTKRQNYHGHNKNYHKIIWQNLKNKISHILIAYYKNEPLSACELFLYKDRGYYVYGGSSINYRNLMASNLLMWEALMFCKNKGCISFDMWGSLSKDYSQSHPWAGFTRFKEGYGGDFVEMIGSYDFIIKPLVYRLYNFAYFLRKLYLEI
ncbi:MAG: peptidoglycan bridge formation glycyltransferase FemA/FemB family protein [bacterium]